MFAPQPNAFLLNPANAKFVSRETERIGSTRTMALIALLVLAIGLGVLGYQAFNYWRGEQIHASTEQAQGTVADGYSSTSRGNTTYYLTISYDVKEQTYSFEDQVSEETYDNTFIGTRVTVSYLADDPSAAALGGRWRDDTERNNGLVIGLIAGGIALIVAAIIGYVDMNNRRLSRHGQFVAGTVESGKITRSKNSYTLTLKYSFTTPDGERVTNKSASAVRNDLKDYGPPPAGTPLTVLVVNKRTFRLM